MSQPSPKPERHPWMLLFTIVTLGVGCLLVVASASILSVASPTIEQRNQALLLLILGGMMVMISMWALVGTRTYTRLRHAPAISKVMAWVTSFIGALVCIGLVFFVLLVREAFKWHMEEESRSR